MVVSTCHHCSFSARNAEGRSILQRYVAESLSPRFIITLSQQLYHYDQW